IVMVIFIIHVDGRVLVIVGGRAEGFMVGVDHCGVGGHTGGPREDAFAAEVDGTVDGHGACEAEEEAGSKHVRHSGLEVETEESFLYSIWGCSQYEEAETDAGFAETTGAEAEA